MLPRNRRLTEKHLPKQKGVVNHSPFFVVRAWRGSEEVHSVFRVVVSKKVSKQAVTRNKLKRRINEAISSLLPSVCEGWKVVISLKQPAVHASYQELSQSLSEALQKINVV